MTNWTEMTEMQPYEVETKKELYIGYFVKKKKSFFKKEPMIVLSMDDKLVEWDVGIHVKDIVAVHELTRRE